MAGKTIKRIVLSVIVLSYWFRLVRVVKWENYLSDDPEKLAGFPFSCPTFRVFICIDG
jgi:hypothetical protein